MDHSRAHVRTAVAIGLIVFLLGSSGLAGAYPRPGKTERISTPPGGRKPSTVMSSTSNFPSVSSNGRFIAFLSSADDLVEGDVNKTSDVFVYDRQTDTIEIVSVTSAGTPSISTPGALAVGSGTPSISGNGRYVAFPSAAVNLVANDTNAVTDVFVHDRKTGVTERISVASDGSESNDGSSDVSISLDGSSVAFTSGATNLVGGDTNAKSDVFVHDVKSRQTEMVSVSSEEVVGDQHSICGSLDGTGRYVAFTSNATNLAPGPGAVQVFVRDRKAGTTELISVPLGGPAGRPAGQQGSQACPLGGHSISADGRFVVFDSFMPDLVPNDSNGRIPTISLGDIFVRDRKTNETQRVSVKSSGEEVTLSNDFPGTISADGRYIAFASPVPDMTPEQPPLPAGTLSQGYNVFVHDRITGATEWISKAVDGGQAIKNPSGAASSQHAALSGDGRIVVWDSDANNLVSAPNAFGAAREVYIRDRGIPLGMGALMGSGAAPKLFVAGDAGFGKTGISAVPTVNTHPLGQDRTTSTATDRAQIIYRPGLEDLLLRLHVPTRATGAALLTRTAGMVYGLTLRVDNNRFEVRVSSASSGNDGLRQRFGLFSCSGPASIDCEEVTALKGGFGTTGQEIVVSLPLERLGAHDGSVLSETLAFSSVGTYELGAP